MLLTIIKVAVIIFTDILEESGTEFSTYTTIFLSYKYVLSSRVYNDLNYLASKHRSVVTAYPPPSPVCSRVCVRVCVCVRVYEMI